ncbi:3D domain-containing protein [Planctomycetota bacterium]
MEKTRDEELSVHFANSMLVAVVVFVALIASVTMCVAVVNAESIDEPVYLLSSTTVQTQAWTTVHMRVTAYCSCPKCCGQFSDGVTASGHQISQGDSFAAADRKYPFGTDLVIPGYNSGQAVKVLDRGGAIQNDRLDVFFDTHEKALQWGVRYLDVKVRL